MCWIGNHQKTEKIARHFENLVSYNFNKQQFTQIFIADKIYILPVFYLGFFSH